MRLQSILLAALAVGINLTTAVPIAGAESELVAREPQGGQRGGKGYGGKYIRSEEGIVARDPQGGQRGGKGYGGQYILIQAKSAAIRIRLSADFSPPNMSGAVPLLQKRQSNRRQQSCSSSSNCQNQKQRIRALERALEGNLAQSSIQNETPSSSSTNPAIFGPDDHTTDPLWGFPMNDNLQSSNSSVDFSHMIDLSISQIEPPIDKHTHDLPPGFPALQEPHRSRGRAALHRAVCNKNESMVRLLLEQGAEFGRQDHNGQTALHLAVEGGQDGLVKLLLEGNDSNVKDSMGRTALFCAVKAGNDAVTKLLLDALIDVNCKDSMGETALHVAVENGSESSTLLLLRYGADIDA
ncbi:ankyrin repeat-containing domain protein [Cadophora sp. MPI-SDFR-AT-0126]|nr:ankyrin repeat-containing domain protein [Leotiomycetes sp. MPI-SDFR-AT-0126]